MDRELVGKMKVSQLTSYLRLPFHSYFTIREAIVISGLKPHLLYRYLNAWTKSGLLEQRPYEGREFKVRVQYRRLFNKITVTIEGVLFELVKEEMI